MKLGYIVLRLRLANTRFGNFVAGSAELDIALKNTLKKDMAFVLPLTEESAPNQYDNSINQIITERFAVLVALANDANQSAKTGITAYDQLHEIRSEFFRALLGWQIIGAESLIYYAGAKLINIDNAYLWYQFEFEFKSRLVEFDGYADIDYSSYSTEGQFRDKKQVSQIDNFDKIYANLIQTPSADIPYDGDLPVTDGFPNVRLPNMAIWVDLTDYPGAGAFDSGFQNAFNIYRIITR